MTILNRSGLRLRLAARGSTRVCCDAGSSSMASQSIGFFVAAAFASVLSAGSVTNGRNSTAGGWKGGLESESGTGTR